ncbi:ArsR/SmtB family transcription factor [Mycobacterium sp. WMMD1722]|uniref:ArsR/SmtB family transcription factor n=1 Tax=Mycobacterium sp. WMMD1722 TaxID=3404117 RepID=UPI003BF4D389
MDEVFRALADPSRRRLLDNLNLRDGQTLRELCAQLSMSRQSVSKHLAVLEGAGLVRTVRRGREKLHHLDAEPIAALSDRWIDQYTRARRPDPPDLQPRTPPTLASRDHRFTYSIYLKSTPERLWQAITDPAYSQRYTGHAMESSWEKGATYTWVERGLKIADPEQVVLESDPYRRLAFSFHTVVPEFAAVADLDAVRLEHAAREPRSRVVMDIEPVDALVRLTVVHDGFEPGSVVLRWICRRWPYTLSALKSGLEGA